MDTTLRTARLEIVRLESSDAKALHEIWTTEPVRRFLWDGEVVPLDVTRATIHKSLETFRDGGFGLWGIREHARDGLIGFAGFFHFREPPELELIFGVDMQHWGRGIATEAARAVLAYGFDRAAFETIVASTDAPNVASIRVIEKLGMRFDRRETVDGLDTLFYRMTAGEWASGDGAET